MIDGSMFFSRRLSFYENKSGGITEDDIHQCFPIDDDYHSEMDRCHQLGRESRFREISRKELKNASMPPFLTMAIRMEELVQRVEVADYAGLACLGRVTRRGCRRS